MAVQEFQRISADDLETWCPWVGPIVRGERPYRARTFRASHGEYEQNYAACLDHCERLGDKATPEAIRRFQLGLCEPSDADASEPASPRNLCVSFGEDLVEMEPAEANKLYCWILTDAIKDAADACNTIVELGAGYGYMLGKLTDSMPGVRFVAADASENAIHLGQRLFRDDKRFSFRPFNFYDSESYAFLSDLDPPLLVYTSHAIEQLPTAVPFLENLAAYRALIAGVIHMEPGDHSDASSQLADTRKRYVETWDYNRDLLVELERRPDVDILRRENDVIGLNPINPSTLCHWRYVRRA